MRAQPELAGTVRTLYESSSWAVVQSTRATHASAVAFHLVGGTWRPDRSGKVEVEILGPKPGSTQPRRPQVAITMKAPRALQESGLWVDGTELLEKGGGSPRNGTIYGAPDKNLEPGLHVAVGFAHDTANGTAVAWTFRVR